jgi:hypothetical protein
MCPSVQSHGVRSLIGVSAIGLWWLRPSQTAKKPSQKLFFCTAPVYPLSSAASVAIWFHIKRILQMKIVLTIVHVYDVCLVDETTFIGLKKRGEELLDNELVLLLKH